MLEASEGANTKERTSERTGGRTDDSAMHVVCCASMRPQPKRITMRTKDISSVSVEGEAEGDRSHSRHIPLGQEDEHKGGRTRARTSAGKD